MTQPKKQTINGIKNNKNHITMKKLILTSAIILGISLTTFADGGLFNRGNNARNGQSSGYIYFNAKNSFTRDEGDTPLLPPHGSENNEPAPLGSGIVLLTALGAGYVVAKKRNEK